MKTIFKHPQTHSNYSIKRKNEYRLHAQVVGMCNERYYNWGYVQLNSVTPSKEISKMIISNVHMQIDNNVFIFLLLTNILILKLNKTPTMKTTITRLADYLRSP